MSRIFLFFGCMLFPWMLLAQVPHWQKVAALDSGYYTSIHTFGDTVYTFDLSRLKFWSTTNAGATWRQSSLRERTVGVFFLDNTTGWSIDRGVSQDGRIYTTSDGGTNWNGGGIWHGLDTIKAQQCVIADKQYGYIITPVQGVLRTENGGTKFDWWKSGKALYLCMTFAIPEIGYVGTANGLILFTDNGGKYLPENVAYVPTNPFWPNGKPIEAIRAAVFDTNYCWAAGNTDRSLAIKTYDRGVHWKTVNLGPDSTTEFTRICLLSHDRVWIAGNSGVNGVVFHTENGNDTTGNVLWRTDTLENSPLYDLTMQSPDSGWAVGRHVWHYTPWQITAVEEAPVETSPLLEQNYPNPVFPDTRGRHETTIAYTLPERTPVSLKICSILGREVATLVHEEQPPGRHVLTWDASRLTSGAPGVLLYVLTTPRARIVKKMMVAR